MEIKSFEDLEVWQLAKRLVSKIYAETFNFPKDEIYGITSQMKRAALSVPTNIAEGFGRYHYLDKTKFYLNSRGSLFELKSLILISIDLGFMGSIKSKELIADIETLAVKLNNLINSTREKATK